MPKLFLVAVDESEFARKAFELAASLLKEGDRLELIHALEIQKTPVFDPLHEPIDKMWNYEQEEKSKFIFTTFEGLCKDTNVTNWKFVPLKGPDAKVSICEYAKSSKADILVMGSRGLGGIKKLILGSVSQYCLENAPCPVLIIRDHHN